ncbi:alkylmercury lyase family protein [Streptomyces sp. CBMA156]|uniref:alkylmercury lyase family protein n=1 Tax=Streptomyces sp. CBMA156 TaxID=1930280 RepID=UPI001661CA76|nr:alkylmercury lyase family protein [Streptomyces sp. CBMA156]MBD0670123.1 alkylmercury lyase [Streptomyces sp. CBMA156]
MRITVLTVADCPNARPALELATAALDGREAEVELVEVADEAEATRLGMCGSPTILIDGTDPFPPPGAAPSLSCRLYWRADGTMSGLPEETALRLALAGTAAPVRGAGAADCCAPPPDVRDVVDRSGRGRRAPAERGLRAVQQRILRHFSATGTAPGARTLRPEAAEAGRSAGEVLAELAEEDFITLDEAGNIRAAYPFSAVPTRHRVRLGIGVEVWSMCAIDALGIPAMLGQDAVISSTDPVSGDAVTVTSADGVLRWDPVDAVVFVGQRPGGGPAAAACCDALNFFTGAANAEAWTSGHPDVPGRTVGRSEAERIGRETFGHLLAP